MLTTCAKKEACEIELTHHSTSTLFVAPHAGEAKLSAHEELFTATKLLDFPHNAASLRRVVNRADVGPKSWRIRIVRNWNADLDIVGGAATFKLCFGLGIVSACSLPIIESDSP